MQCLKLIIFMVCFFQSLKDDDGHPLSNLKLVSESTCLERLEDVEGTFGSCPNSGRGLNTLQQQGRYGLPREELQLGGHAGRRACTRSPRSEQSYLPLYSFHFSVAGTDEAFFHSALLFESLDKFKLLSCFVSDPLSHPILIRQYTFTQTAMLNYSLKLLGRLP
jgi:hypothetical protein